MTTSTPVRRRLFTSPAPSSKRRRVTTQTRIPKLMQPEIKQWVSFNSMTVSGTNAAIMSIPTFMSQGDGGDQFSGSKFRILRVRVYFDYTDVATTSGVRFGLGIPKDPSSSSLYDISSLGTMLPANLRQVTMLKEMFLKTDGSNLNGYMEWNGPLNVEMNSDGTAPLKNNLMLQIVSENVGTSIGSTTRARVEVLFTG